MEDILCRICLEECSQLTSLFEKCEDSTPYENLKNRLKIEITDDGPSHICSGCFLELENCLKFLEKCEKSNKILVSRCRNDETLNLQSDCFEQDIRPTIQQSKIESVIDGRNVTSRQSEQQSNRKPCVECGSRRICEHKPPIVYTCQICQKIFTRKFNYNIHVKRHLGRRDWPCVSCGAAQVSSWLARTHCATPRRRNCPMPGCLRSYTSAHNLNTHIRSHTGDRPYGCKECGKRFTCKSTLNDHVRIHTGVKPYMCSICGARFATNKLSAHLRTHEERPHRPISVKVNTSAQENGSHCCIHCSARYTHKQSLNRHLRKHHSSSLQKGNNIFCSVNINDLQEC